MKTCNNENYFVKNNFHVNNSKIYDNLFQDNVIFLDNHTL